MKKLNSLKLAVSSLMIGAGVFAVAPSAMAERASANQSALARTAASAAKDARTALSKHRFDKAVDLAERAVAAMPRSAEYRLLMGDAYLSAGRFSSAETAFSDALKLSPGHDRAALKLALAKTALGQTGEAQGILEAHRSVIPAADFGLAMALAGDPQAAVAALEQSVRAGQANAKTRQNLALSYALSGRWLEARATAALDLPTDLVDKRIVEWAALARPANPWEQVASILGVSPKMDRGQPEALALNYDPRQQYAAASPAPVVAPEPKPVEVAVAPEEPAPNYEVPAEVKDPAPVRMAEAVAAPAAETAPKPVEFAATPFSAVQVPASQKIVPVAVPASTSAPRFARASGEGSRYVVQLGAFSSAGVAADGWSRATRRWDFLKAYDGRQAKVNLPKGTFYRLSFSGFASRDDASRACARIKSSGGNCFVRSLDGADSIRWASNGAKRSQQLASR